MTIKDFVYIETILNGTDINSIVDDKMFLLLSYFNNMTLTEIGNLKLYQYQKLVKLTMPKLIRNVKPASKWFYYRKNIWIKKDINEFNWGDFVDLFKLCGNPVKNINLLILKIYKPYFDIKELPNFGDLDVNHIWSSIEELIKLVNSKIKRYKVLFPDEKKVEGENKPKPKKDKFGLLDVSFSLLNEDVTKLKDLLSMNIDTILLYLVWSKEQSDKLKENQK
jgi:hypothetical protein